MCLEYLCYDTEGCDVKNVSHIQSADGPSAGDWGRRWRAFQLVHHETLGVYIPTSMGLTLSRQSDG